MKEYFLKLYQYNVWANARVVGEFRKQKVTHEKALTLMSHILAAQFLWLHRIQELPPPDYKLWNQYSINELERMSAEAGDHWLKFISDTETFDRELSYKNYTGNAYTNNVQMIMIHLVNHSTYHRGQIALLMREHGYEPINTDFITYDRVLTGQLKN